MAAGEEKNGGMMATSSGYNCYSDTSSTHHNPQIYNLTAAMEIIGFPSKNMNNLIHNHNPNPINHFSTNLQILPPDSWNHHHHLHLHPHQQQQEQENRLVIDDDPSFRSSHIFSGDGNEDDHQRLPSQGSLSLSLTSSHLTQSINDSRFGQFQIRNSKYLEPAKDLLNELCNLGTVASTMKPPKRIGDDAVRTQPPPPPFDFLELQRRKAKLLHMLQEVERRYKHYCDQMKAVVSSFEAVAGDGAAAAYSAMASKAMSRHFRCLKDGIMSEIKAMRERDGAAIPGASKGETPRLRILDQKLRQQRAFQQMGMVESHPWRPQRGLPEKAVAVLRSWLFEHFLHPYPSEVDKRILARQTGLSRSQVSNWFINARVRLWKPMVEEMYLEDQKDVEGGAAAPAEENNGHRPTGNEDRKPTQDQLMMRTDSECLSSIINTPSKNHFSRGGDHEMGPMQFDFSSSYTQHGGAAVSYLHENAPHNNYGVGDSRGGGGGGGVSLTLGLQQHGGGGGGVTLAFTPAAAAASQSSLFYGRDDEMEDEYSIFDGENQNLQYRNLMGAQLLHDLAG